jgi:hypothetical protein
MNMFDVLSIQEWIQNFYNSWNQHKKGSKEKKKNKDEPIWDIIHIYNASLFADNMILYLKHPKISTQKLLDTINSFSNVAGYKINLQKSVAFLYTNNEQIEREYKKTIPFK